MNHGRYGADSTILQQSSMQGKSKHISSLDLKYLDAKFTPVPDTHHLTNNLQQIRKTKSHDLPSILKGLDDQTTLDSSALEPLSRTRPPRIDHYASSERLSSQTQKLEIDKYRSLIAKIKSDNHHIHREITNLYRDKKICDNEPRTKPVRIIQPLPALNHTPSTLTQPETAKYERIYESLSGEDNPYRGESLQIQKKFANNNLHKNFEAFLVGKGRRVPEFIKNIR